MPIVYDFIESVNVLRIEADARISDQMWAQSGSDGPKLDKSGDFFRSYSVYFGSVSQNQIQHILAHQTKM